MLVPVPPVFRKRRGRIKPSAAVAALELLSVIDVSTGPGGELDLTAVFNTTAGDPLVEIDAADPGQWSGRYGGTLYFGNTLEMIAFNQVRMVFFSAGTEAGADVINYASDPSDIFDATGRQLGVVSGFGI